MEFNRPPRIQQTIEFREIVIPAPKTLPSRPKINWLTLTLPLVGTMLAVGLMVAFYGATSGYSILFFLPMVFASVISSIVTSVQEKNAYIKQVADEKKAYSAMLDRKETELSDLVANQRNVLENKNPDLVQCLRWASTRNLRLGERQPNDPDFLNFRLGVGRQKTLLDIKMPNEDGRDENYIQEYARADNLKLRYSYLEKIPITTSLREIGCLGIAGTRDQNRMLARAAMAQLATHHWPQELNFVAICSSIGAADEWNWLNKISHRIQIFSPAVLDLNTQSQQNLEVLELELHRRKALLYHHKSINQDGSRQLSLLPAVVVIFDHVTALYERAAFSMILREGRELGMYGLILVEQFEDIPVECGATLEFNGNKLVYKETGIGKFPVDEIFPDTLSAREIEKFSNSLAEIQWLMPADVMGPPPQVSLLELFGVSNPEDLEVENAWDGNHPFRYFRSPIGRFTPSADLVFDLNESNSNDDGGDPARETHGPHGVIGGMTGSGKSELLRTIVLSMAITHHPYDINFALIDYKGGGAFKDLEDLPHVVGVVTDIENHANYAGRVIQSLTGEINTRKQILADAQIYSGLQRPHIDDYRKLEVKRPLPRLVIIFDEFAEFKDQHPEESRKLINIARQGRSLGVHLILCTQNPATAIDDQVRQNSKFSIALGVNSPDDSRNLIGIPDAFSLEPGMAFIFVKSPQKFRIAFSGKQITSGKFANKTEAQAIVSFLKGVAVRLGFERPSQVWPSALEERLYLPDLLENVEESGFSTAWRGTDWDISNSNSFGFLLGRYDDPVHQRQPLHIFGSPGTNQNMLIFGATQSGKSTLLLTLACGIARTYTPSQAYIYCLDLGGRSMIYKLKDFPHAADEGAIVTANDSERINSLFRFLRRQIAKRKKYFQQKQSGIPDDQVNSQNNKFPLIYVLVDGLTARFTELMDNFNDQLAEVILEGQSLGINVIITANVYQDVHFKIFSYITNRLILRPLEKTQVDNVVEGIPSHLLEMVLRPDLPPGRGLIGGRLALEFQAALPVHGVDDEEQGYYLDELITLMRSAWQQLPRPPRIRVLPPYLSTVDLHQEIDQLQAEEDYLPAELPIALNSEIRPVGFSLENGGPTFLVTSSAPRQGKTTLLNTLVCELADSYSPSLLKIFLIDFHTHALRELANLPHVNKVGWFVSQKAQLESSLNQLKTEIIRRSNLLEKNYQKDPENFDTKEFLRSEGYILIVIDDYNTFRLKTSDRDLIKECVLLGEESGVRLITAETGGLLGSPFSDEFLMIITRSGCGISLGGSANVETYFSQAKIPASEKIHDFPIGRGYMINQSQGRLIQVATYCPPEKDTNDVLHKNILNIIEKYKKN